MKLVMKPVVKPIAVALACALLAGCGSHAASVATARAATSQAVQGTRLKDFGDFTNVTTSGNALHIEAPEGLVDVLTSGTTTHVTGYRGSWTITRTASTTIASGPAGTTTISRSGSTINVSEPTGTTTMVVSPGKATVIGPSGTTTIQGANGTYQLVGPKGAMTFSVGPVYTKVTGSLGEFDITRHGTDVSVDSPDCVGTIAYQGNQTQIQGTHLDPIPWLMWDRPADLTPWLAFADKLEVPVIEALVLTAFAPQLKK